MRKLILLLTVFFAFNVSSGYASQGIFKKKNKASTSQNDTIKKKERTSKYDRAFVKDKGCVTAKGDFLTLHKSKGKLYIEMPVKYLNRELLIASTISEASDTDLGTIGYKPKDPMHVKFVKMDSLICMAQVNNIPTFDNTNATLSSAIKRSTIDPLLSSYPIYCYTKDSASVVFEMTSLFTGNDEKLSPMTKGGNGINITGTFNSKASRLGEIKAFEDNVTIKSYLSYTVTADLMKLVLLKRDAPMTFKVTRTILLLHEKKMQSRLSDARIGIFNSNKLQFSDKDDYIKTYSVIHKWNLQPKDTVAFKNGQLSEPIKPITFYMDNAFPKEWAEGAKEGILRWNKAFEKIGFKNAIQILDYPADDPNFDPDNLKYSCIRYVPARVSNAMGPSWVDPNSGEIINASVIVYHDVVKLLNQWRFVQTAQVDENIRHQKMSNEMIKESIAYILAHEVGHCLGFMHNMAASSAYKVDSLRSATFTQKYGTTPSIMDYARFNYVAQVGDKGVKLTPPDLGPYDEYLVEYAYKPIFEAKNEFEEAPVLDAIIDAKAGDPIYRYGKQQIIARYDPSALEEDLGDDPIKAASYGVKNLKYILAHLNEWITNDMDPDASYRDMTYQNIAKQYNRYISQVLLNVGGIYLSEVKCGTQGVRAKAVDKQRQKEALKWVVNELKNCSWIDDKHVTDNFGLRVSLEPIIQYYTALDLYETLDNVTLSAHLDPKNGYNPSEYMDDMYNLIWDKTIKGLSVPSGEQTLQKLFVEKAVTTVTKKTQLVKVKSLTNMSAADVYAPSVGQMINLGMDPTGLLEKYQDLLQNVELEYGKGYIAQELSKQAVGYGYGWQYRVNLRSIDRSKALFNSQLLRIQSLIKSRVHGASGDTKAHYQSLLLTIQEALDANN